MTEPHLPPQAAEVEPTLGDYIEACDDMQKLWRSRTSIVPDAAAPGNVHARLHTVNGLATHSCRLSDVIVHLLRHGLSAEVASLVRTSFECAVTAMWASLVPDGVEALLNEDYRSRRHVGQTLSSLTATEDGGDGGLDPDDEDHASLSNAQARQFKQLCDDLVPGGDEFYVYYRFLCWFSHPTNYVMDLYGDIVDTGHPGDAPRLRLRRAPRVTDDSTTAFAQLNAVALLIASVAVDRMDVNGAHRQALDEIAARIGCATELRLTDKALRRLRL